MIVYRDSVYRTISHLQSTDLLKWGMFIIDGGIVLNANFNNISVISWQSVLLATQISMAVPNLIK
jgi:hypothetical protein